MVKSFEFPNMLYHNSAQLIEGKEATSQNLYLTIGSEKGQFKFDPFFGVRLKRYMFDQNSPILRDLLWNEIYEQIVYFLPQISIDKSDIHLESDKNTLYVTVKYRDKIDFTLNTLNLVLFEEQE